MYTTPELTHSHILLHRSRGQPHNCVWDRAQSFTLFAIVNTSTGNLCVVVAHNIYSENRKGHSQSGQDLTGKHTTDGERRKARRKIIQIEKPGTERTNERTI